MRPDPDQVRFKRLGRKLESPIEQVFWQRAYKHLSVIGQFAPQVNIRGYRVDFTLTHIPNVDLLRVVIELDGYDYHKTPAQHNHDAKRDRVLMKAGWYVVRFTGSQVYGDCDGCVREVVDLVRVWSRWLRQR